MRHGIVHDGDGKSSARLRRERLRDRLLRLRGDQGFSYNCFGAYGMAWDARATLYVTDWPTGNVYKFGTSAALPMRAICLRR